MKRSRGLYAAAAIVLTAAATDAARGQETLERAQILRPSKTAASFSVELPDLARVQGTAFFRTSVAISNNTNNSGVIARYQFSYTCVASTCAPPEASSGPRTGPSRWPGWTTSTRTTSWSSSTPRGSSSRRRARHDRDAARHFRQPRHGQRLGRNRAARNYNRLVENDPLGGRWVRLPLRSSSSRPTRPSSRRSATQGRADDPGALRTNLGIRNTDINGTNQNVSVELEFYDTATGQRVGNRINSQRSSRARCGRSATSSARRSPGP